jgi:hypothetical protein
MAARSRGTLRRAARDTGVRSVEAALVMAATAKEEAVVTEEGGSVEVVEAVEVAAMRWVKPEDRRAAVAKEETAARRGRRLTLT